MTGRGRKGGAVVEAAAAIFAVVVVDVVVDVVVVAIVLVVLVVLVSPGRQNKGAGGGYRRGKAILQLEELKAYKRQLLINAGLKCGYRFE